MSDRFDWSWRWLRNSPCTFGILAVLLTSAVVRADEKLQRLKVGDDTYMNVTVTMVTATDIAFNHSRGMCMAKLKNLDPEMQHHFGYASETARQAEAARKLADAKYRSAQAAQAATYTKADEASIPSDYSGTLSWRIGLPGALQAAQKEQKCVLLLFDGSDWCPASAVVNRQYLSTEDFKSYAREKLVLVLVDFPKNIPQSDTLKASNAKLYEQFNIRYYPTFVLLDSSGKKLGGTLGTQVASSKALISKLEHFRNQ